MDALRKLLTTNTIAKFCYQSIFYIISIISWKRLYALFNGGVYWSLKEADHDTLRKMLKTDYYIILIRRSTALTTYVISLASFFTTGKFSFYSHALMNVEGDIDNNVDFKLIEATAKGVHWSSFMSVFDCDNVCLLKPKGINIKEWTLILDVVKDQYGKPYDSLFDLTENQNLSCVELVYTGLSALPDYEKRFPHLQELIKKHGLNLTPQMFYDCPDLEVVYKT